MFKYYVFWIIVNLVPSKTEPPVNPYDPNRHIEGITMTSYDLKRDTLFKFFDTLEEADSFANNATYPFIEKVWMGETYIPILHQKTFIYRSLLIPDDPDGVEVDTVNINPIHPEVIESRKWYIKKLDNERR